MSSNGFCNLTVPQWKSEERQKPGKISGLYSRTEKVALQKTDSDSNRSWSPWNSSIEYVKETGWTGDSGKNWEYSARMLQAILNKSWRQHPTKQQLYGRLPPIRKTSQVRPTRHAGHCWRSKDKLISGILLWTPSHGRAKTGRPARTYIQQLCADTGRSLEDLPEAIDDRDGSRESVKEIRADGARGWWWCDDSSNKIG